MDRPLTIALANSARKWIGEAAHVAMLYEQLEALGHRPWLICRRGFALEAHAQREEWRHLSLHFNSRFHPLRDGEDWKRWVAWIREQQADLVHAHRGKDHWLGTLAARGTDHPVVRTRHVVMPVHHHVFNRWLYLRATDAVICVSHATRAGFGGWADRLPGGGRVILSAVDCERFHPGRRSEAWRRREEGRAGFEAAQTAAGAGAGEPVWYGLVGRLRRIKGYPYFLEAAARVARRRPEARFLIAGPGGTRRRAQIQARGYALGLGGRLRVCGRLSDLPETLASLDVGVIASVGSEGSSRIALEMMAAGRPLVATRVGGIAELTEPAGATRLVAPRDAVALAEAMEAWGADAEERRRRGQANRDHVLRHHQPADWARAVLDVYASVVRSKD